ncbi:MAG: cation-efflux pump [Candidatus Thermoplasmatota archaeon]|nr:cation-efflux pump [Candidatus Thermoplasmatota archaeon]
MEARMSKWLLRLFVKNYENTKDPKVWMGYGLLEGWLSIIGNTALFFVKYFIGISINSISLIADAFHTLSDTLTSVVVVIGFKMSAKAPDKEHPFGHGRIEAIASIVIAVLLGVVGADFMWQSIQRLMQVIAGHPAPVTGDYIAMAAIALSVIFKESMAEFSINLGKIINSQALKADAWHHRSDAIASFFVLIAIIAAKFGALWLDPIMGIGVSLLILKVGVDVLRESSQILIGRVNEEEVAKIEETVKGVAGCEGVHRLAVHDYGMTKVVSMHIEVSDESSFDEAHVIADTVEKNIENALGKNVTTVVHVDPKASHHNGANNLIDDVIKIILGENGVMGAHKMWIIGGAKKNMVFHLIVDPKMSVKDSHEITRSLKAKIWKIFDGSITIHVEPCEKKCAECISRCPEKRNVAQK